MAAKRVLILGPTGVDKRAAAENLMAHCGRMGQKWRLIEFEDRYLWPAPAAEQQRGRFLDSSALNQAHLWNEAWDRFKGDADLNSGDSVILSLHGCITRGHYGVRSVVNATAIAHDFNPELVITLVADVYDMWWRTQQRAEGLPFRGQPTLEQLIFSRRHELIVGDQIAALTRLHRPALMLSTAHPTETLAHVVSQPADHRIAYLSFPISQPRDLLEGGDTVGMVSVSEFLRRAYEVQHNQYNLALLCPLTIDEIPFALQTPRVEPGQPLPPVRFDRDASRWNLQEIWPANEALAVPPAPDPVFPGKELVTANGIIWTDVTWRDYRLVDQSDFLLVFNPIFRNRDRMAGSVKREIHYAINQYKPVYLFQDPEHDQADRVGLELDAPRGQDQATMGPTPVGNRVVRVNSLDALLAVLER